MSAEPRSNYDDDIRLLRWMRLASIAEATTLLGLVVVAVPLKHIFGQAHAVSWLGPVHGVAFLVYVWMLTRTLGSLEWTRAETIRAIVAAFAPFGGFVNEQLIARKQFALQSARGRS